MGKKVGKNLVGPDGQFEWVCELHSEIPEAPHENKSTHFHYDGGKRCHKLPREDAESPIHRYGQNKKKLKWKF